LESWEVELWVADVSAERRALAVKGGSRTPPRAPVEDFRQALPRVGRASTS